MARPGLECADKGHAPCGTDRSRCRGNAGAYLGTDWPLCPVRAALDDTRLQFVLQLEAASQQGPISDWPHGYAAWVQPLWAQLKAATASRAVETKGGSSAD